MSVNTSQVVHIVAEIVVLLSMTVYFMHENKKLASRIDSLSKKVEEQEEKLEKHDGVILDILKHLESSNKPKIVVEPLPSLKSSSSISYKPGPGLCYINSNGDEVCTVPTRTDDVIHEEEEEEEEDDGGDDDEEVVEVEKEVETKSSNDDDVVTIPSITDNVVILMAPVMPSMEPVSTSTVEEVIEEDESLIPPSAPKKKRKRHKQRSKQPTVTDIDKELENELNELLSEELGKKN
jgi:hypothetical protein